MVTMATTPPNPGFQLAQVLATMKDAEGRVLIDGYYDGITLDENAMAVLKKCTR